MTDRRRVLETVSVDRIRGHIRALEGVRHPVAAPEALERAAVYIRASLQALGCEVSEHLFSDGGRDYANIIGTRPGTRFPEQRVIVLAHYDTVSTTPGADDNASGIALLLELAALFARSDFERTLQFIAVNLEEHARDGDPASPSRRGSRALAEHARADGWDIDGVVVLESVAYAGDDIVQTAPAGLPFPIPDTGNFIAVIGNEASRRLVEGFVQAIERNGIPLPCQSLAVPANGEMLPDARRSDHAPFWDNGFPAVMVTDTTNFRSPHYHQPGDRLETLNLKFAADVCRAAGGLVMELAGFIRDSGTGA